MSIKESALNAIAALTNSDFVRMVTSAGASRKATLQTIAQHIIENYAGSTLAGSQQSVKSALDALNSNVVGGAFTNIATDYTAAVYYQKRSGWVFVRGQGLHTNLTAGNYTILATLPTGHRPPIEITFSCSAMGSTDVYIGRINTSGQVQIYVPTAHSDGRYFVAYTIAFPAA